MAGNKRIYYAVEAAALGGESLKTFTAAQTIYGLQSIGINTRFNLEQVFELGQLEIYENVEALPDIEITLEKLLDGKPLIYHLATVGAPIGTLSGRSNIKSSLAMSVFSDQQDSSSGVPLTVCWCSGLYVSSLNYTFSVEGNHREAVTMVGNDKLWSLGNSGIVTYSGVFNTNADVPANYPPIGIARRQHMVFGNTAQPGGTGQFMVNPCVLPLDVDGIDPATGFNLVQSDGNFGSHIQNIRITANLGRDQLHELGRKGPYWRYVNFPVEVRTDIEVISTRGDMTSATQVGVLGNGNNLADRPIFVSTLEGTKINLGNRNKLQTTTFGGANAGTRGGNATVTYSFVGFNDMTVIHPQDPTVALAA